MRKRIYEIIEIGKDEDIVSKIYDIMMLICIVLSIIPLMFKTTNTMFFIIDKVTVVVFIIDYLLRLITADYKIDKGKLSFVKYPFTFMAIIDLVSILPSLTILQSGFRLLKVVRLIRTFRVFRVFKAFRYSKNVAIIISVFRKQKESLFVVLWLAVGYIFLIALIMFSFEQDTFDNFFEALYWATISLTSVGYGDIYATSVIGRVITMISSVFGIAIVALPSGIIVAGYQDEIAKQNE